MQICYEIIFPGAVVDRAHRPEWIVNVSNDAWYGPSGPPQHLAQARLRAIEERLPVARATPTGISAMIDADGAVGRGGAAGPGRGGGVTAAAGRRAGSSMPASVTGRRRPLGRCCWGWHCCANRRGRI